MTTGFMADECFSGPLIRAMKEAGFDVIRSADFEPAAPDHLPTHGVVRVALKSMDKKDQSGRLIKALFDLEDTVRGAMVTIEPKRTRVRPLK